MPTCLTANHQCFTSAMARDIRCHSYIPGWFKILNRWGLNQSANEHVCKTSKACGRGLGWSMSLETELSESQKSTVITSLMYPSAYAHSTRFLSFSHAWVDCITNRKNITYPVVYSLPTFFDLCDSFQNFSMWLKGILQCWWKNWKTLRLKNDIFSSKQFADSHKLPWIYLKTC